MKAVKDNRVYTITEQQRKTYAAQGFDIVDDGGNIVQHAAGKTVPYTQYAELLAENERLKSQLTDREVPIAEQRKPGKSSKKE